ncbi:thiamine-phosphate pyrophosphorylase [Elusimicrobiota bacterium]
MTKKELKRYFRIFDANLNRCREGLRVIEDSARFVLAKNSIYKSARNLRHKLDSVTRDIYPELLKQRDSVADSGRKIKEGKRNNLEAVLAANFRRAEESLRVLEEYSRIVKPQAGREIKNLRFAVYTIEKKLLQK